MGVPGIPLTGRSGITRGNREFQKAGPASPANKWLLGFANGANRALSEVASYNAFRVYNTIKLPTKQMCGRATVHDITSTRFPFRPPIGCCLVALETLLRDSASSATRRHKKTFRCLCTYLRQHLIRMMREIGRNI